MRNTLIYFIAVFLLANYSEAKKISPNQNKIEFFFDDSGNQVLREDSRNTAPPKLKETMEDKLTESDVESMSIKMIDRLFLVSRNTVSDEYILTWSPILKNKVTHLEVISLNSKNKSTFRSFKNNSVKIDLSGEAGGEYLANFYLKDMKIAKVQKKLMK